MFIKYLYKIFIVYNCTISYSVDYILKIRYYINCVSPLHPPIPTISQKKQNQKPRTRSNS